MVFVRFHGGSLIALRVRSYKVSNRNVKGTSNFAIFIGSTMVKSAMATGVVGTGGGCNCNHLVRILGPSPCEIRPGYRFTHRYNKYRLRTLSCSRRLVFGAGGIGNRLRQVNNFASVPVRPVVNVSRLFRCEGGTRFPMNEGGRKGVIANFCTKEARGVVRGHSYTLNMTRGGRILSHIVTRVRGCKVRPCGRTANGKLIHRILVHCKCFAGRIVIYLVLGKGGVPGRRLLMGSLYRVPKVADVAVGMGGGHDGIVLNRRVYLL